MAAMAFRFSKWPIDKGSVFAVNAHAFAFVNLKPVLPGHVLVSTKRIVAEYSDLNPDEALSCALCVTVMRPAPLCRAAHDGHVGWPRARVTCRPTPHARVPVALQGCRATCAACCARLPTAGTCSLLPCFLTRHSFSGAQRARPATRAIHTGRSGWCSRSRERSAPPTTAPQPRSACRMASAVAPHVAARACVCVRVCMCMCVCV